MSVGLYMDVHVRAEITDALTARGVDVLTAQGDGARRLDDPQLLDRAAELNRVLFSQDADLLREAARRQRSGEHFAGLIYGHQHNVSIAQCIEDLELLAVVREPEEFFNWVQYLPLK